ncbi:sigma-70 family RNA polymerase sigma factor [Virgisporangium aurantiacum]|uniref:Sigma-70, region 4 n=1 Tax=Virgisporangium aurantiacum TaxID=175570 RepID=A0A8J4E4Q5_9ACTN|nr:sigma-70 family RNA polymerase sigma factor [Virgisporangium aurantiacum]GIJ59142.1 hypothetical protein Vau01_066580 [Virgisporangium aurantiacum]
MAKTSSNHWPASPLAAAERAFEWLTCDPDPPLVFDARGVTGLPPRSLPLGELRRLLISESTSRPVRDRVWRDVVLLAREGGPDWVIAAVGLAMPGLRRAAGRLATGWHGDTSDFDAELLTGFLDRLRTVDLDEPRICGRLIDAGARAVKAAREWDEDTDIVHVGGAWSVPPHHPWDHPDWVLARAVALAVIDPDEHLLISATRLEDVPLRVVADKLGISVPLAAAWRRKAERRLAEAIGLGELTWAPHALPEQVRKRRAANAASARRRAGRPASPSANTAAAPRTSKMTGAAA